MKSKQSLKTRVICSVAALLMTFNLLPLSTMALAADSDPVSVEWVPQQQTEHGIGCVALSAALKNAVQPGGAAAAMIEIALTEQEAAALDWTGATVLAGDLLPEQPETGSAEGSEPEAPQTPETAAEDDVSEKVPEEPAALEDGTTEKTPDESDELQNLPESSDPAVVDEEKGADEEKQDGDGEAEPLAAVPLSTTRADPCQAVLVREALGGAVLRILLSGANLTYQETLTFSAANGDQVVEVTKEDIRVRSYASQSEVPSIFSTPLLTDTDSAALTVPNEAFTILQKLPGRVAISAAQSTVSLDEENGQVIYDIIASKPVSSEEALSTFTLTWPKELTRPEGALSSSGPDTSGLCVISSGSTALVSLRLPENARVSQVTSATFGLSVSVVLPVSADSGTYEMQMTVEGGAFIRPQEHLQGEMVLSTVNENGETVSASVLVTADQASVPGDEDGYTIEAMNWSGSITQTVGWADGNDEAKIRPDWGWGDTELAPRLYFTIGGVRRELTRANMSAVGMTAETWPTITAAPSGFTIKGLPTQIREVSAYDEREPIDVVWSAEPPQTVPSGYAFVNVTDDNQQSYPSVNGVLGWYYMLQNDFGFTVEIRKGSDNSFTREQMLYILSNLEFLWNYTFGTGRESIRELILSGSAELDIGENGKITISGLWKYNLDGSLISYRVAELGDNGGTGDGKLVADELGQGVGVLPDVQEDWLQVLYNNSGVPNHSTDTDAVYNGGRLQLILSGQTTFFAEKRWLDAAPSQSLESRPDVTFTLWRYREGESYSTAAPVSDGATNIVTSVEDGTSPTAKFTEDGTATEYYYYPVTFDDVVLDKYDSQGYAYIYGVRESMVYEAGDDTYEALYGVVNQKGEVEFDKLPYGEERLSGDTLLYNGGTLSNRLKGSVAVSATKKWEAAAYQSEFRDVAVELTLESKLVNDSDDSWKPVTGSNGENIIYYLYNFTAERLSESGTVYMPQYDSQGSKLEYRWVETAVFQGVKGATYEEVRAEIADGTGVTKAEVSEDGAFTLTQKNRKVVYVPQSEQVDGVTKITNKIRDEINYNVEKQWAEPDKATDITINLYQYTTTVDLKEVYVSFSFDADGRLTGWKAPEGTAIKATQAGEPWKAVVEGLPRFTEGGQPYSYALLEENAYPVYTTTRDPDTGDYTTIVYNGGDGKSVPILVEKVWLDDGDELHRTPATFTVYNIHTGEELETVVLGGEKNPGVWYDVLLIPMSEYNDDQSEKEDGVYDVQDLYVVETSLGANGEYPVDHHLNFQNLTEEQKFEALYQNNHGENDAIFDVVTTNHRYQVSYRYERAEQNSGIQGSFTVTNRRLGNIDMTVNKEWVNGNQTESLDKIADELRAIAEDKGRDLVLAFRLVFADESQEEMAGWNITYSGVRTASDTIQVGGEKVPIWDQTGMPTSSEQVILGVDQGATTWEDTAYFFNLPKYDAEGKVVEYTVEEVWLDITDATSQTPPTVLTKEILAQEYPDLYHIWDEYIASYEMTYNANVDNDHNTHDEQELTVTNTCSRTKTVTWYKQWNDEFAYNNNLRPDIFLDIYRLVHVEEDGALKEQIERVRADLKWDAPEGSHNSWTITLSGMEKYDDFGYEIPYYAVERTVVAAGNYDYQACRYSLTKEDGAVLELGTRDHPVDGVLASGKGLDLKGEGYVYSGFHPDDLGIGEFGAGVVPSYPRYALIEEGTFTNALADNYPIEGIKYWTSLPSGWPASRLPGVTFYAYQYAADDPAPDPATLKPENAIAQLKVASEQWAWPQMKSGLGYRYLMEYVGENTLAVENGILVCVGPDGEQSTPLPRYDEKGALYNYLIVEQVDWADNPYADVADGDQLFKTSNTDFTVTNQYLPTTGSVQVKKLLYLPLQADGTPEAFPAVTFQLTRQKLNNAGTGYEKDSAFATKTKVITSAKVRELYEASVQNGTWNNTGYVTEQVIFENLPLYAPDGTRYQYTVTEVKSQLQGYDTWAASGDREPAYFTGEGSSDNVSVDGLMPENKDPADLAVQATFLNKWSDPQAQYVYFTAVKVWEDYENEFGFRPGAMTANASGEKAFADMLVLKRTAPAQSVPGGGGASKIEETLDKSHYDLTITEGQNGTWNIEIHPAAGTTFEKFAPNGRPWSYTLAEPLTKEGRLELVSPTSENPSPDQNKVYTPSNLNGVWPVTITTSTPSSAGAVSFGTLKNSVKTAAAFKKVWTDQSGSPIAQDYLGLTLSVTFRLQVAQAGTENWQFASDNVYVKTALGDSSGAYNDTTVLSGAVTDRAKWSGSYANLPAVATDEQGKYVFLKYRVIETQATYGTSSQIIPWSGGDYGDVGTGLIDDASFQLANNTSTTTNQLSMMEVSVEKVWEDADNQLNTRPGVDAPMTWSAWFVLQRSTNEADWSNVALVKLYGSNQSSGAQAKDNELWEYTFAGLPLTDYGGKGESYTYRVRELQPREGGYALADSDVIAGSLVADNDPQHPYNPGENSYITNYEEQNNHWTVTNTLMKEERITLTGQKIWEGDKAEERPTSITVVLYGAGDREVQRLNVTAADGWSYEFKELPKYDAQGQEIQYYVREEGVAEGYQVEYDGMNIVNRKENPVGTLRVTKEVRGDGADYERSFSFTVALSNAEVNGVYGDMTFTDGVAKFQLKHGQTAQAEGLPAGVSYKVEEEKAENYTIFSSNQEGTITADSVTKAAFVNSYTKPDSNVPIDSTQDSNGTGGADVRTGDEGKLGLYGILTTLFAGGFILFLYLNKKSKDKKNGQKPLP